MTNARPGPTFEEASTRATLDVLPRAVTVTDASGRIVTWNPAAEELYGWQEAEVLGRTLADVLVSVMDDREADPISGEHGAGDRTVLRRDGQPVRVYWIDRPILDDAENAIAVVGTSEDVTATRFLEQAARDLTDHLRLALDAAAMGTWRWDRITNEVTWDTRMEELSGLAPGTFAGTFEAYADSIHPEDRERVLGTVQASVKSLEPYQIDYRVILDDGTVRWLAGRGSILTDGSGTAVGAIGCCLDVTERIEAMLQRDAAAKAARSAVELDRIHHERLELLSRINAVLADAATREDIMVGVTREAVPRLGDWCSIYVLPDPDAVIPDVETFHLDPTMVSQARTLIEQFPYDPSATIGIAEVIRTGQPEMLEDAKAVLTQQDVTDDVRAFVEVLGIHSVLTVPMIKRSQLIGGLQFLTTNDRPSYTSDDLTLASAVAARVASSLENRRLTDEQRIIASTLQQSLLPARLPDVDGLDLAVRYWAAGEVTEVGGDFYDVFPTDDAWVAAIGDVCGTGPEAAALTALARHTIRHSSWRGDTPSETLSWLNHAMRQATGDSFLTAALVSLRPSGQATKLEIATAGHPLPILVPRSGPARLVGKPGTLAGVFDTVRIRPVHESLDPGDVLVLYTDGVTDVPPPSDLTDTELVELVESAVSGASSAEVIADRIRAALVEILPIEQRDDDIALLVIRSTATELSVPS